jgi:hypothetical protein
MAMEQVHSAVSITGTAAFAVVKSDMRDRSDRVFARRAGLPSGIGGRQRPAMAEANQFAVEVAIDSGPPGVPPELRSRARRCEGEPWRRLFMSDAATAFASLALSTSE